MDTPSMLQTNIIDLLGLQALPQARKDELLSQMSQVVQDRITDRLIEAMSADQRAEFGKMLDADPQPDVVDAFFKKVVPDYQKIAEEETAKFKQEMTNEAAVVRQIAQAV